uniref:Cupredoxin domain-containing protein n=1 Tax=Thermorudis sp. TaxID=1969470 RepID=A0A7C3AR96_9BACT
MLCDPVSRATNSTCLGLARFPPVSRCSPAAYPSGWVRNHPPRRGKALRCFSTITPERIGSTSRRCRMRIHLVLRTLVVLAASALLVLLAAACAAPKQAAPAGESSEVRVVAREFSFEPATIEVQAGRPFTLILENQGAVEHEIEVHEADIHLHAGPGQTVQGTFTIATAGTYEIACEIPGHKEAGMVGELVVH